MFQREDRISHKMAARARDREREKTDPIPSLNHYIKNQTYAVHERLDKVDNCAYTHGSSNEDNKNQSCTLESSIWGFWGGGGTARLNTRLEGSLVDSLE